MLDYGGINKTNFHNILPDNLHMSIKISISPSALKHHITRCWQPHTKKKSTKKNAKSLH